MMGKRIAMILHWISPFVGFVVGSEFFDFVVRTISISFAYDGDTILEKTQHINIFLDRVFSFRIYFCIFIAILFWVCFTVIKNEIVKSCEKGLSSQNDPRTKTKRAQYRTD
jgi:hypothetical protein